MSARIEGVVHLVTPLHVSAFDDDGLSSVRRASGGNHKPTMTQPLYLPAGERRHIPYFPASGLRGRLRRAAAARILQQTAPVSVPVFHFLTCGSTGGPLKSGTTIDVVRLAAAMRDLYLGVFGGGPRLVRSGYSVRDLVPICSATLSSTGVGMVPDRFEPAAVNADGKLDLIARFTCVKKDDLLTRADNGIAEYFENFEETAIAYAAQTFAANKARKDSKVAVAEQIAARQEARARGDVLAAPAERVEVVGKTTIANMFSIDAIPAGTRMYLRIDLAPHLSDAQIYFLTTCLADVFTGTKIGGWGRAGFGVVRPELVLRRGGEEKPALDAADDGWSPSNEAFGPMQSAFATAFAEFSRSHVESLLQ